MTSAQRKKLINNVALITGATRGIGKAVAAAYLREGARVFICARNQQEVAATVRELRYDSTDGQIDGCAGDVGKETDVCRIVDAVIERFQTIDTLINNASLLGPRVALVEYPFRQWEEVIRVNLHGVFILSQRVVKRMIAQRQWFHYQCLVGRWACRSSSVGRLCGVKVWRRRTHSSSG